MANVTGVAIYSYSETHERRDVNRRVADRIDRIETTPARRKFALAAGGRQKSSSAREGRAELRDHETSAKCQWLQQVRRHSFQPRRVEFCPPRVDSHYPRIPSRGSLFSASREREFFLLAAGRGDCTLRADDISGITSVVSIT